MAARAGSGVLSKARKFVLTRTFQGEALVSDFRLVEEDLPELKQGQILCEAEYLSLDPYQRAYSYRMGAGDTMLGSQVARVVRSRAPAFPEGRLLVGYWGWRDRTVVDPAERPSEQLAGFAPPTLVPDLGDLPSSLALGVLGMPGNTAYFGLLEVGRPKPGETVAVTGAAGAVGSLVGQIAKIKGCRAVGLAGSDEKVRWLTEELGFDAAVNYKTADNLAKALRKAAPDGVDVYFDNVGGVQSSVIVNQMRRKGRVAVCGSISAYNSLETRNLPLAPVLQPAMVMHLLRMEGFNVYQWADRWDEGVQQNLRWIREGKLKYRETVTQGFENLPRAFVGMMGGENVGKAVVKV